MTKLRTAVIGTGYLGSFHAQKYAELPHSQLVAVCDLDFARATALANTLGTQAVSDYRVLAQQVDAVSIVTPTPAHAATARFFLEQGVHVLVEKPMTPGTHAAAELIQLAQQQGVWLQVGHIERFNPSYCAARSALSNPHLIDARRQAPFKVRGTDVNVVLDMMIHDLDLVLDLVPSRIRHVSAQGASVLSATLDLVQARIEFDNGCIAQLSASRVSPEVVRHFDVVQADGLYHLDLQQKQVLHYQRDHAPRALEVVPHDALRAQLAAFLDSILQQRRPLVDGEAGKRALSLALQISQLAEQHPLKLLQPVEA